MNRPPYPRLDRLTPEQAKVRDAIVDGPRGQLDAPLHVWLNSPALADKAQQLGACCRYEAALEPRLRELAILIMAAYWRAGFEWNAHAPIALKAGLEPSIVNSLLNGNEPHPLKDDESALYRVVTELLYNKSISEESYLHAEQSLGQHSLTELVIIIGYYTIVSMTIKAFNVPCSSGDSDPFASKV